MNRLAFFLLWVLSFQGLGYSASNDDNALWVFALVIINQNGNLFVSEYIALDKPYDGPIIRHFNYERSRQYAKSQVRQHHMEVEVRDRYGEEGILRSKMAQFQDLMQVVVIEEFGSKNSFVLRYQVDANEADPRYHFPEFLNDDLPVRVFSVMVDYSLVDPIEGGWVTDINGLYLNEGQGEQSLPLVTIAEHKKRFEKKWRLAKGQVMPKNGYIKAQLRETPYEYTWWEQHSFQVYQRLTLLVALALGVLIAGRKYPLKRPQLCLGFAFLFPLIFLSTHMENLHYGYLRSVYTDDHHAWYEGLAFALAIFVTFTLSALSMARSIKRRDIQGWLSYILQPLAIYLSFLPFYEGGFFGRFKIDLYDLMSPLFYVPFAILMLRIKTENFTLTVRGQTIPLSKKDIWSHKGAMSLALALQTVGATFLLWWIFIGAVFIGFELAKGQFDGYSAGAVLLGWGIGWFKNWLANYLSGVLIHRKLAHKLDLLSGQEAA